MKEKLLLILLVFSSYLGKSQKYDYNWMVGYQGLMQFDFNYCPFRLDSQYHFDIEFLTYEFGISDFEGMFLFCSNGIHIVNRDGMRLLNSSDFNAHPFHELYKYTGPPMAQGALVFNDFTASNIYHVIHLKMHYFAPAGGGTHSFGDGLFYSKIDMNGDDGLGEVVEKGSLVSDVKFENYGLTAVKHANGRDWWIIMPELLSNRYHKYMLDTSGIRLYDIQEVDFGIPEGDNIGQAVFSPDGEWYVRNYVTHYTNEREYLDIFKFDRCSGELSEQLQFDYDEDGWAGGCAISPNSRFLYVNQGNKLFQYDLWSEDIEASSLLIDEYDGFADQGFSTTFYQMQLAPDGKIYMSCISGNHYKHIIQRPNQLGNTCQFEQHTLKLPKNSGNAFPNNPNYRLGPIDDSTCDTLAIDNVPLAGWRYDASYLDVCFTDNSFYQPQHWSWTFGDGGTSTDTLPYHSYIDTGRYEVCLTVSNQYGADTFCKFIHLVDSFSASYEVLSESNFILFPNPAQGNVILEMGEYVGEGFELIFYTITGEKIAAFPIENNRESTRLDISMLNAGLYLWTISNEESQSPYQKIVILD